MKRYNKYKPSGIEWLGDIPEHWESFRFIDYVFLKHGYQFRDFDFTDEGVKVIKITQLNQDGSLDLENCSFIDSSRLIEFNSLKIKEGDILMALTGGTIGKIIRVNKVKEPLLQNYRVGNFFPNKKFINKTFLFHMLSSQITFEQINYLLNRNGQPNIGKESFKNMFFPLPNLSEQTAIANYLDTKTAAIDRKIELLTTKADKYKSLRRSLINETVCRGLNPDVPLKDSCIEWIGMIPEHWEVKRVKDIFTYTTGNTPDSKNESYYEGNNTWICIGDISEDKYISDSKMKISDKAISDLNMIKTPKGSLLYSFKLSIGKMAFVEKDVYTNEAILSIFPNKHISLNYIYYMLPYFLELAATENIYGAKMLNQKIIANALLVVPKLEEQIDLASYLDSKTIHIDTILTNISEQITKLTQLRKTLINDVVTGKIKVTEVDIRSAT